MKLFPRFPLVFTFFLVACAAHAPKPAAEPAPEQPSVATAPAAPVVVQDSISGTVVSDDTVLGLPSHVKVRLRSKSEEVGTQMADADGHYRFEGPLSKGHYELSVSAGALHGAREITFNGGEMKGISIVIAKSEPRRHRRRRH